MASTVRCLPAAIRTGPPSPTTSSGPRSRNLILHTLPYVHSPPRDFPHGTAARPDRRPGRRPPRGLRGPRVRDPANERRPEKPPPPVREGLADGGLPGVEAMDGELLRIRPTFRAR